MGKAAPRWRHRGHERLHVMTDPATTPDSTPERPASASASLRILTVENHRRTEQSLFQRRFRSRAASARGVHRLAGPDALRVPGARIPSGSVGAGSQARHRPRARRRVQDLEQDLTHFAGMLDSSLLLPATKALLAQVHQWAGQSPVALLGVLCAGGEHQWVTTHRPGPPPDIRPPGRRWAAIHGSLRRKAAGALGGFQGRARRRCEPSRDPRAGGCRSGDFRRHDRDRRKVADRAFPQG